jgi:protein-serine/threonine kinase
MKDRFGWAASSAGIVNAQARVSGDAEIQSMVELLSKANVWDKDNQNQPPGLSRGPFTGPADVNGENIFEKTFSESSLTIDKERPPALNNRIEGELLAAQFLSPIPDEQLLSRRREMRSAPSSRRVSLKRTFTDLSMISLQSKLMDTLAQPSAVVEPLSPTGMMALGLGLTGPTVHVHSSKSAPVSQAVFRTEGRAPWTILAANDLACLVFGVTQSEVRKISILEVVREERREWLESKLYDPNSDGAVKGHYQPERPRAGLVNPKSMGMGNGMTAQLLSKPPARQKASRRAKTDDGYGSSTRSAKKPNHSANKSRGVLLCGDVVPIQKRNGSTGSASLWVMEKRGGLIWVLEEITENVAYVTYDAAGRVVSTRGDLNQIWGPDQVKPGVAMTELFPSLPQDCIDAASGNGTARLAEMKYFTARTASGNLIPTTIAQAAGDRCLQVSSFPHVAGMMVLSSSTLNIISSNSVFSGALFGQERPEGHHIRKLIPEFDHFLHILTEQDQLPLIDGMVIPEHSFRRARALWILRENKANAASIFWDPTGLPGKHRDGSRVSVDVQMRVVKSETAFPDKQDRNMDGGKRTEADSSSDDTDGGAVAITEVVYALWITYSRQIHAAGPHGTLASGGLTPETPARSPQLTSGQKPASPPPETASTPSLPLDNQTPLSLLSQRLNEAAAEPLTDQPGQPVPEVKLSPAKEPPKKRSIADYVILEEMGNGAYGQVKLARLKKNPSKKVVLKYVTKTKILVDTWTRDRRLGTVPLEIHVLDYLRRDGLRHPNIVEMEGFFEDKTNYYIEMVPHGLPGMDLFDYIELRSNMDESECRNIFKQVVDAIHHLHTKALVVHRDIKDENVILDGDGNIKLIDFGSAAYIKNGPFDVFVGTIGKTDLNCFYDLTPKRLGTDGSFPTDYAAPEVLHGKSYRGKEQDVWALGILLYTIVYKENPFYSVDEILDHPLRIPFLPFSDNCIHLIRRMLDRDVDSRITISEVLEHPWMKDT